MLRTEPARGTLPPAGSMRWHMSIAFSRARSWPSFQCKRLGSATGEGLRCCSNSQRHSPAESDSAANRWCAERYGSPTARAAAPRCAV